MNDNEPMLPIAFYAALILNRLRNEREIQEHNRAYEEAWEDGDRQAEQKRHKVTITG